MRNPSKITFLILIMILFVFMASALTNKIKEQSESSENGSLEYKGAVLAHIHRIGNGYGSTSSKAGIFVWKYFTDMNSYERRNNEKGFTPYGKEAEKVISGWFETNSEQSAK